MPDNGVPEADDPPLVLPPELAPLGPEPPELGCVAEPFGPAGLTGTVVVGEGMPPFDGAPTWFLGLVVGVGTIESPGRLGADVFVDAVVEASIQGPSGTVTATSTVTLSGWNAPLSLPTPTNVVLYASIPSAQ